MTGEEYLHLMKWNKGRPSCNQEDCWHHFGDPSWESKVREKISGNNNLHYITKYELLGFFGIPLRWNI